MDIENQLTLSYYKEVAELNGKHRITVVQHQESRRIFVKKVLGIYNLDVYLSLKENPVSGIPRIYEVIPMDNELIVIEEYVSGLNLEQIINQKGSLTERETVDYALKLCNILSDLHSHKPAIIHRDVKPTNVIVTPSNDLVLIDLNAAKYESEKDEDTTLLGTKGYAAPEQYGFGSSGVQTDIYAVGILMNIMLTGSLSAKTPTESKLGRIIEKSTELSPKYRYRTIDKLIMALEATNIMERKAFRKQWMQYLPPGFRSLNPGSIILASGIYYLIFYCCLSMKVENANFPQLVMIRLVILFMFMFIIFFSMNYLDIQSQISVFRSKKKPWNFVNIIVVDLLAVAVTAGALLVASFLQ